MGTIMGVHKVLSEELFCKDLGELNWNLIFYFSPNSNEVEIHKVGDPLWFPKVKALSLLKSNFYQILRMESWQQNWTFWGSPTSVAKRGLIFYHWRVISLTQLLAFFGEPTFLPSSFLSDTCFNISWYLRTPVFPAWQELDVNKTLGWSSNYMHFFPNIQLNNPKYWQLLFYYQHLYHWIWKCELHSAYTLTLGPLWW